MGAGADELAFVSVPTLALAFVSVLTGPELAFDSVLALGLDLALVLVPVVR